MLLLLLLLLLLLHHMECPLAMKLFVCLPKLLLLPKLFLALQLNLLVLG
jgi:hypothetical protein